MIAEIYKVLSQRPIQSWEVLWDNFFGPLMTFWLIGIKYGAELREPLNTSFRRFIPFESDTKYHLLESFEACCKELQMILILYDISTSLFAPGVYAHLENSKLLWWIWVSYLLKFCIHLLKNDCWHILGVNKHTLKILKVAQINLF